MIKNIKLKRKMQCIKVEPFFLLSLSVSVNRMLPTDERFCSLILEELLMEKKNKKLP